MQTPATKLPIVLQAKENATPDMGKLADRVADYVNWRKAAVSDRCVRMLAKQSPEGVPVQNRFGSVAA